MYLMLLEEHKQSILKGQQSTIVECWLSGAGDRYLNGSGREIFTLSFFSHNLLIAVYLQNN